MNSGLLVLLLRGNIWIALCAVGMSLETSVLLQQPFHPWSFYLFIFFATLFAYNLYYVNSTDFAHHRLLTGIGLAGSLPALYAMPEIPVLPLGIICALSVGYMLPVFTPLGRNRAFTIFKLMLLVMVWVLLTFITPLASNGVNFHVILFGACRMVFIAILCLFFFIRDNNEGELNAIAKRALRTALWSYVLLGGWVLFSVSVGIGSIMLALSGLLFSDFKNYVGKQRDQIEYLFFIDGKMLLQSIFVMVYYYFVIHESRIFTQ